MRSETRASDLFPDYPEYNSPTLSYETHPTYLNIRIITGLSRSYINNRVRYSSIVEGIGTIQSALYWEPPTTVMSLYNMYVDVFICCWTDNEI